MDETQEGVEPRPQAPRLLKKTLRVAVILYAVLIGAMLVPFVQILVWVLASVVEYLWVYVGSFAACLTLVVAWLFARGRLKSAKQRLQFAYLSRTIAFGAVGIALMASSMCLRYDAHLIGHGLHTWICLDAETARQWARDVEYVETESGLERQGSRPPLTLRLTGLPVGDINVIPETRNVTIEQGGPLSGHLGTWLTARGGQWDGVPNFMKDARHLKIKDGVWVWETED